MTEHTPTNLSDEGLREMANELFNVTRGESWQTAPSTIASALKQVRDAAKKETVDQISKMCCSLCAHQEHYELRQSKDGSWGHYGKLTRDIIPCDATAIRQMDGGK